MTPITPSTTHIIVDKDGMVVRTATSTDECARIMEILQHPMLRSLNPYDRGPYQSYQIFPQPE